MEYAALAVVLRHKIMDTWCQLGFSSLNYRRVDTTGNILLSS